VSDRRRHLNAVNTTRKSLLLKAGLLGYAALVLLFGWSYGVSKIRTDRALTLEASNHQLEMTATTLAKHIEAMIFDGVGAASAGANEVEALDRQHRLTPSEMSAVLSRMLTGGEYVNSLFIVTPSLFVAAQRNRPSQAQTRPAWAESLLDTAENTWVGKPLNIELGDKNVLIPIARRVVSIRGEASWAGALFSVSSLDEVYRALPVEHSGVSITSDDALMLIRIPIDPTRNFAGMDISSLEAHKRYKALPRQLLTTLQAPDPVTGKLRQYAARRIEGYPAIAVAGRNIEDSLVAWNERTHDSIVMMSIASIALTVLTLSLYILLQRRFQAIVRSEQRFQLAVQGTNDGIWEWEIAADSVYYSSRFMQLLGFSDADDFPAVTHSFWERIHPEDKRPTELSLQRHLLHRDLYDVEFRLRHRNDEYRWFRARGQALWDEHGNAFRMAGSISDINDHKRAENELENIRIAELHAKEEFAQHLLTAQEQERQRLANELHDSVGQNLSLIKNHALMLQQQDNLPSAAVRHIASLERLTAEVIAEVRTVAQNLRPLHIDELGLTNALDSLLNKVGESGALTIEKRLENVDDAVNGEAATHLFRIVQEAVNNIIKHARAKTCRINLERDIHCVRLTIDDDGVGFNVNANRSQGLGLASLDERCRMLSATLKLDSIIGKGTSIRIEYPVVEELVAPEAAHG